MAWLKRVRTGQATDLVSVFLNWPSVACQEAEEVAELVVAAADSLRRAEAPEAAHASDAALVAAVVLLDSPIANGKNGPARWLGPSASRSGSRPPSVTITRPIRSSTKDPLCAKEASSSPRCTLRQNSPMESESPASSCRTRSEPHSCFHLRRDHVTAAEHRAARTRAFETCAEAVAVAARPPLCPRPRVASTVHPNELTEPAREGSSWRPQGGVLPPLRDLTPMLRPRHKFSTPNGGRNTPRRRLLTHGCSS